ncbi:MAG: ATP-binding cassette domain-containing protein [Alphaproteobacteria bacterium]
MAEALIAAIGLAFRDGAKRILDHVDLEVAPSEIVTVVGPNGSGKTTLLRLLIGAIRPTSGKIVRHGALRIGYTPQKLALDRTLPLTVDRFLALGGAAARAGRAEVLTMVGLPCIGDAQMIDLSGGETQRVLLARALLRKPNLLVLDEPTQGLDQPGEAAFYKLIERVRNETGCAVLLVSHDLHVVMSAADRVICLNGHICCEGAPTLVLDHPEYRRLFGHGTGGALALYQHEHDHHHHHAHDGGAPSVDGHDSSVDEGDRPRRAS